MGERAEAVFVRTAEAGGWQVVQAPEEANRDEHWDWRVARGRFAYRVDVKAMKKICATDANAQDTWHWVELHGKRTDDPGWLYGGKADLIAFETRNSFVLVQRQRLVELVEQLTDFGAAAASCDGAQYKVYTRPGQVDQLTLVETEKLRCICWGEWLKL
ncbi:MAG: hypothetical protein HY690_15495 [Chloroflexi bacterium]|nr:hypothetical protein [Chloroflexota bacterium]